MRGIFRLNEEVLASQVRGSSMLLMSSVFVLRGGGGGGGKGALSNNAFRFS